METKVQLDSYIELFNLLKIDKEQFLTAGLSLVKFIGDEEACKSWKVLKRNIDSKTAVPIRGYGRNFKTVNPYKDLYEKLNISIEVDKANNSFPTDTISALSIYSKSKDAPGSKTQITNYQVSHIFGRTHNVYCFTAPWNIAYVPKIFDPLTGHEAKGDLAKRFSDSFQKTAYGKFEDQIKEFNSIMDGLRDPIATALNSTSFTKKFKQNVLSNFAKIEVSK